VDVGVVGVVAVVGVVGVVGVVAVVGVAATGHPGVLAVDALVCEGTSVVSAVLSVVVAFGGRFTVLNTVVVSVVHRVPGV
ncbi:MAG: hypothetical protein ABEJ74_04270, partial [Haloferacaceae archaeon]